MSTRNESETITSKQALEIAQTVPLPEGYFWAKTHNSVGIRISNKDADDHCWWCYWWSVGGGYNPNKYTLGVIVCHKPSDESGEGERNIGHFAPTIEEAPAACQFMINKLTFCLYE